MRQGEVKKRCDSYFHKPEFRALEKKLLKAKSLKRLRDLATSFTNGDHGGLSYIDTGVRYLRGQSITEYGLDLEKDELYVSEEDHIRMIRAEVIPGDVVLTIAGSIGNACVIKGIERANINQAIVKIRPSDEILSDYLALFLNSHLGKFQTERLANGAVQLNVNFSETGDINIVVPSLKTQRALVSEMETTRAKRQSKLAEAERLLQGIDSFILDELGLKLPKEKTKRPFAVRFGEIKRRTDPDYHSPYFRQLRHLIQGSKHKYVKLKDILQKPLTSGFAAGRNDQADDNQTGVPHVRPFNISPNGQFRLETIKYVPNENVSKNDWLTSGEVLFNNTNSTEWVGKTAVFGSDEPCACSNHITRIFLDKEKAEPIFIAALFNVFRSLGLFGLLSTNFNNQAGINSETLSELEILLPPLPIQRKIVAELETRRAKARQLREEAERLWEEAKEKFEKALLG